MSETFLVCWRRMEVVPDDALPWLLGVARKVLASQWRSEHRQQALRARMEDHLSVFGEELKESVGSIDSGSPVIQALACLDEGDREVLILLAWDGLTYREGAKILGCSRAAFAIRVHRARKRLLRAMEALRIPGEAMEVPNEQELG